MNSASRRRPSSSSSTPSSLRDDGDAPRRSTTRIGVRAGSNALLGRDDDVAAIERLLQRHRLVTVLGAGGLGKTRLAQEVATRAAMPLVVVVELASIRTDDDVVLALASTLGVREASTNRRLGEGGLDVRGRILARLDEAPALLVLDNCEHVIDGAARWAAELLGAIPSLRIVATSRSPLTIGAEQVYPLEPLGSDAAGPAVELFVERATAARPGVELPLEVIARLCTRLDGLPLAIELAAARVRSMTVEQIESRLENRFALLAGGDRTSPERQRTLLAVIEWSWALLTPDEQRAMCRLSWFPDGFGLDAADVVTGSADAAVAPRRAHRPVTARRLDHGRHAPCPGTACSRRCASSASSSSPSRARRSARSPRWTRGPCASRCAPSTEIRGPGQVDVFRELDLEQDNLVEVLRRAIASRRAEVVFPVFAALAYRWTVRSAHSEILAFGEAVLDSTSGSRPTPELAPAAMLGLSLITATHLATGTMTGARGAARMKRLAREGHPLPPWLDRGGRLPARDARPGRSR